MHDFIGLISLFVALGAALVVFLAIMFILHDEDTYGSKVESPTSMITYTRNFLFIIGSFVGVYIVLFTAVSFLWVMVDNIYNWFF